MRTRLVFSPGARFFKDEDGYPVMVAPDGEGIAVFAVGRRGIVSMPSCVPVPSLEDVGVIELDEASFRELIASSSP